MIVAIQKYLIVNKLKWKLVEGDEFEECRTVLDNIMQERTAANIGVVKRQAGLITYEHENSLWEKNVLGEDTPDKLRNTVLFLLGINCCLRAVEDHYNLRRDTVDEPSQLSFVFNPRGVKCVVYQEDSVTKTHDGGLHDMRHDRKVVWIYPNAGNISRCPVRLIEKYLSLCPARGKKSNFYLQSLQKPTPIQWYGVQVVGQNKIGKVVKTLMKDAGITGFFTNHSARRTGGTRLFRAGVQRKLVKETTGHSSDAVDKYQLTSDDQREFMSKIMAGEQRNVVSENPQHVTLKEVLSKPMSNDVQVSVSDGGCKCKCGSNMSNDGNIGEIVNEIIKRQGGNATIKIAIEITKT